MVIGLTEPLLNMSIKSLWCRLYLTCDITVVMTVLQNVLSAEDCVSIFLICIRKVKKNISNCSK